MTPFPPAPRTLLAAAGFLAVALAAPAADAKLTLSRTPDGKAPITAPILRPNSQLKLFVVVENTSDLDEKSFRVTLDGPTGSGLSASKDIPVVKGKPVAVGFEPPPPKKDAPPPAPKKDADPAPKAEPPPGLPLPAVLADGALRFQFTLKVWNLPKKDTDTPQDELPVTVVVQNPSAYLDEPVVSRTGTARGKGVTAVVQASKATAPKAGAEPPVLDLVPPVEVALVFPPQLGVKALELRAGTYSRKLFRTQQKVELSATDLPLTRAADLVKFNLTVDGVPRAYVYTLDAVRALDATGENRILPDPSDKPVVRLFPVSAAPRAQVLAARAVTGTLETPRYPTLPSKDLRFRVEVDNAPPGSTLELRIDRTGNRKFADPDETIPLGLPREVKVWVDAAGADGLWTVSNTVGDHVAGVDVSDLRGPHTFQALLRVPKVEEKDFVRAEYTLVVDETPPPGEEIDFGGFPVRHTKGVPLPVYVSADDPESRVERVTVYLGKPGPDGKMPDDAPKFEAARQRYAGRLWLAQVQLPPPAPVPPADPKAPPVLKPPAAVDVTAVAENGVGLTTTRVVRIQLVDPPLGTIRATVMRGSLVQPGVEVFLRDAEAKERGAAKTGTKGKDLGVAEFTGLQPGTYHLFAGKPDASTGQIGSVRVQVPEPTTSPPKAVDVTLDLKKRR